MASRTFNTLELFAGGAGLGLGIQLAVPEARCVCYVEREAYAAAVLAARMEEGRLAAAPVWDDVCSFDGRPWRGLVDCVAGGFPCQDISNAGKRAGITGSRSGLWKQFARIIDEARPEWVFVENVAALVGRGLSVVLGDLASLGFDAEWTVRAARDVGAPHQRRRFFLLAHALSVREPQPQGSESDKRRRAGDGGTALPNTVGAGLAYVRGSRAYARCAGFGAPDGVGWWDAEPDVGRVADGVANRLDRLRMLGNGVVPQQAAAAWSELMSRYTEAP